MPFFFQLLDNKAFFYVDYNLTEYVPPKTGEYAVDVLQFSKLFHLFNVASALSRPSRGNLDKRFFRVSLILW